MANEIEDIIDRSESVDQDEANGRRGKYFVGFDKTDRIKGLYEKLEGSIKMDRETFFDFIAYTGSAKLRSVYQSMRNDKVMTKYFSMTSQNENSTTNYVILIPKDDIEEPEEEEEED